MNACATEEGTRAYAGRFPHLRDAGHFRNFDGLSVSSVGLGTYLGREDDADDALYREAVREAVESGCNLLDSAVNYRCMRSERAVGAALKDLFAGGKASREEVVVCTKGGFLPFDGSVPENPMSYFLDTFLRPGVLTQEEVAAGCHCMAPKYLRHQVETSLSNLGLSCLDLYYVHNPETQLSEIGFPEFERRLEAAFRELEALAGEGKIRRYGTATWSGFRVPPNAPDYLSLERVLACAERAGGSRHRFRAVQLPYNLAMAEAYGHRNQEWKGRLHSLLEAARKAGVAVFTSASLLQGKLARGLPPSLSEALGGLDTDAQRALQFARSTPGVTAALVGMKRREHAAENLALAARPPASGDTVASLFRN